MVHANLVVVTACSAPGRSIATFSTSLGNYRFGGQPDYPQLAHSARITGVVVLRLNSEGDGRVVAEPLTEIPFLTAAAVADASQWRVVGQRPSPSIAVYEFALDNQSCESERNTAFWYVAPGYVRLSGCGRLIDVKSQE